MSPNLTTRSTGSSDQTAEYGLTRSVGCVIGVETHLLGNVLADTTRHWKDSLIMSDDASTETVRATQIEHHEFEVDGVRVHHFPSQETTTTATLLFAAGVRDETLPTLGALHALEHLVMGSVRRTPIEINGSVDLSVTDFTATGSPHHVAAFLEGVCRALTDPPLDRIGTESKVLDAEGGEGEGGSPLALARYGWRDLGVAGGPGPGPRGIRPDAVQRAAERWFVAANAVLIVDGPWLEGLRLPLRPGPVPEHERITPRQWEQPHAITVEGPACAANIILPAPSTHGLELLAVVLIENRVAEVLRHGRGLVYDVSITIAPTTEHRWDTFIETDPPPGRVGDSVRALVEALGALLLNGPSEEEFGYARAQVIEAHLSRDAIIGDVTAVALSQLQDAGIAPFDAGAISAVTLSEMADYLRATAYDLLLLVDEEAESDLRELGIPVISGDPETAPPLPAGEVFRPPMFALALSKDARASRVALTSTGLAHQYADTVVVISWDDVAGVMRDEDGDLVVFGLNGGAITVGPYAYRKGQRLADAVLANVPDHLVYDAPPEEGGVRESTGS